MGPNASSQRPGRLTWRAYILGIICGVWVGLEWAALYPQSREGFEGIPRLLLAFVLGGIFGVLGIRIASKFLARLPARSPWETQLWRDIPPWDRSVWPPGTWAGHFPVAWFWGIAAVIGGAILFGPVALLLLAVVVTELAVPSLGGPISAYVFAAVVAIPLGVRIGLAVTHYYDFRLKAERETP
jgi:hypothetical protein